MVLDADPPARAITKMFLNLLGKMTFHEVQIAKPFAPAHLDEVFEDWPSLEWNHRFWAISSDGFESGAFSAAKDYDGRFFCHGPAVLFRVSSKPVRRSNFGVQPVARSFVESETSELASCCRFFAELDWTSIF